MDKTSARINVIRAAARGVTLETLAAAPCPTCGRPAHAAYFRTDAHGRALEGCVDAHHAGRTAPGEATRWFRRPGADQLRAQELRRIR